MRPTCRLGSGAAWPAVGIERIVAAIGVGLQNTVKAREMGLRMGAFAIAGEIVDRRSQHANGGAAVE